MTRRDFNVNDIHLALDGELAPDERDDLERWLDARADMKALRDRYAADRETLVAALAPVLAEPVPEPIARLVRGEPRRRLSAGGWLRRAAAAAGIFLAGGLAGYLLKGSNLMGPDPAVHHLTENAIGAYVTYAAALPHPVDVGAEDKHYLESWLSRRTGLKVIAPDLTASGFELLGGRILPSGDKVAALLVYRDRDGNQLSIYVVGEGDRKTRGTHTPREGGPTAIYWLSQDFGCAIVGSLPQGQLAEVARSAWRQMIEAGAVG